MQTGNPAKQFLRQYRSICGRINALAEAIDAARDRVALSGVKYKERVQNSPATHDPIADAIAEIIDETEALQAVQAEASQSLLQILAAIQSLPDETQKELLTWRYINGRSFSEIAARMNYSEPQLFAIHANALAGINRWIEGHKECEIKGI